MFKEKETCPACDGSGVQYNRKTGLKVICPVCKGIGKTRIGKSDNIRFSCDSQDRELKDITRKRIREGKPNYGLLGNWAVEEFGER